MTPNEHLSSTLERKTLRVHNWDKWQSYRKDRQPPWIKIHRSLIREPKWLSLSDVERGHLLSIWILAADNNGAIPADPQLVRKLCYLDAEPNLNRLIELQFLDNVNGRKRTPKPADPPKQVPLEESRGEAEKIRVEENPLTPKGGKRAHQIPPDWKPNEEGIQYGLALGHSLARISELAEDMRIWAGSAGGKNTLKKDWDLTFKGWMRRERQRPNGHAPPLAVKRSPFMQAAKEIRQEQTDAGTTPHLLTHRRA